MPLKEKTEYSDERFERLINVRQSSFEENEYYIYEIDKEKRVRVSIVDKDTGRIIRETD